MNPFYDYYITGPIKAIIIVIVVIENNRNNRDSSNNSIHQTIIA